MYRMTARALLVLLLVGTLVPVALAISAPLPHACCMRKPMHQRGFRELRAAGGENRNCCSPLTTAPAAELGPKPNSDIRPLLAYLPPGANPILFGNYENDLRPVRGPPAS